MPEAEDNKELGRLARSIDSLFAGPDRADAESAADEVSEPAQEPMKDEVAPAEVEAGEVHVEPLTTEVVEAEPLTAQPLLPEATETEPLTAQPLLPEATETEPLTAQPLLPEATETEALTAEPLLAETEPHAADQPAPLDGDFEDLDADDGPEAAPVAPNELDGIAAAVADFLWSSASEDDVRAAAMEHAEARDYDAIADAVEALVSASDGDGPLGALGLARELAGPMVRGRLVQRLAKARDEDEEAAFYRLCTALGEEMAAAIRDQLADTSDRHARRTYYDALVAMGEASRPVVMEMADDENRFLARNAVAILGEIGGRGAAQVVTAALANSDPRVRREALLSMAKLGVEKADLLVFAMLDDPDDSVRSAAVMASGELKIERAVRELAPRLEEAYETDEVLPLLQALGQIGDPGAVAAIEKHAVRERFAKPRTAVRVAAYQALNHIGTPHARRLLNQALNDKDPEVKAAVKELLHFR